MSLHDFRSASGKAVADERLGAAIRKTTGVLETRRAAAVAAHPDFESLRTWGRARKLEVSGSVEEHARLFAERVRAAGGVTHFARNAGEACATIVEILAGRAVRTAVKSKSMTAEEVGLGEVLAEAGVAVTETDLGEFIIQLAGEKPSHILAPAIHRDRAQVADLFAQALDAPPGLDVEALVGWARKVLRERFLKADAGITGANFAVAETGTLVLVTNEGNGRMATALPRLQVAVVGIDKVIPRLADVPGFLSLLTRSASGQTISTYVTMVTGPRRPGEEEGPAELHVVLVDNGRTEIAAGPFREILHCLHCGSCLTHCPVYRSVGGHAYESTYAGPMGDVLSPLLWGKEAYPDLPWACTLCGRCAEVCPMKIPLPDYHRGLRNDVAKGGSRALLLSRAAAAPALYRAGLALLRKVLSHPGVMPRTDALRRWTSCRETPKVQSGPSFRDWWRTRTK